jgi:hypothetical protein
VLEAARYGRIAVKMRPVLMLLKNGGEDVSEVVADNLEVWMWRYIKLS